MDDPELDFEQQDPEVSFKVKNKQRDSSSSEDRIDTSDELMDVEVADIHDQFIADCAKQAEKDERKRHEEENRANVMGHNSRSARPNIPWQMDSNLLDASQQVIREAEARKGQLFTSRGNPFMFSDNWATTASHEVIRSADVDEN